MNILVIEDDPNKRRQIVEFLNLEFDNAKIVEKYSYQSGLKEILDKEYEVIILDMSMPTFDITSHENGGRPRPFAGKEIIMQMNRKKIKIPIIVVTQFENFGEGNSIITLKELSNELNALYNETYMGTVYYNAVLNNWKDDLKKILNLI